MDDQSICFSIFYEKVKMHDDLLQLCVEEKKNLAVCTYSHTHTFIPLLYAHIGL